MELKEIFKILDDTDQAIKQEDVVIEKGDASAEIKDEWKNQDVWGCCGTL